MKRHLIVFARFPEVGKCKTRLIPELGEHGAAEVHSAMTKHTLDWARELRDKDGISIEVRYAGGDHAQMASTFGHDLDYVTQCEGDLGKRLIEAFEACVVRGATQVVVVGTDCPQLSRSYCKRAFDALESQHVVLAPAVDGGYTLLGVNTAHRTASCLPALFEEKTWGTDTVLEETISSLMKEDIAPRLLPVLSDVDHPEDLGVWYAAQRGENGLRPKCSVIIPVYDRETDLETAIQSAQRNPNAEIILCAAGANDETLDVARRLRTQFIPTSTPRANQLNQGAIASRSSVLVFLHADTELPPNYGDEIQQVLADPETVCGAFRLQIRSSRLLARIVEWGVTFRTRWFQMPYGDQAIFIGKEQFQQLGGFPNQEIMEDYVFAKKSKALGKVRMLESKVLTSGRRWQRLGFIKTTIINQLMILGHALGISKKSLAEFYRRRDNR